MNCAAATKAGGMTPIRRSIAVVIESAIYVRLRLGGGLTSAIRSASHSANPLPLGY